MKAAEDYVTVCCKHAAFLSGRGKTHLLAGGHRIQLLPVNACNNYFIAQARGSVQNEVVAETAAFIDFVTTGDGSGYSSPRGC